ncbi:MAG: hypothetical protein CMJ78_15215 [Planctomycetaceae bacterium]|nr:hypothetical protein [Planctomycetaceae bacterium]
MIMNSNLHLTRRQAVLAMAAGTSLGQFALANDESKAKSNLLFDGKTLTGWHTNPQRIGHGTGGRWQVENGTLTGEQEPPGSGNGGLLLSDKKYGDFELTIDMHPDWGPCSGVFFRCTDKGAGFQMYVDYHDGGNVGHLRGEMPVAFAIMPFKFNGVLDDGRLVKLTTISDARAAKWPDGVYKYCCTPQQFLKAWKVGEWNTAKIRCVGKYPQITTWINGERMCHFDGENSTLPGYDKERVFKLLGREGSIGAQVHGGKNWPKGKKCRWKNIRIREL